MMEASEQVTPAQVVIASRRLWPGNHFVIVGYVDRPDASPYWEIRAGVNYEYAFDLAGLLDNIERKIAAESCFAPADLLHKIESEESDGH